VSNHGLVEAFYHGHSNGLANNMEIAEYPEGATAVIGYCHAVYAYRPPEGEYKPVVFTGWSDASPTTGKHISLLTNYDCIEAPGRAKKTDVYDVPTLEYLMEIKDDDTSYSKPHMHMRNQR